MSGASNIVSGIASTLASQALNRLPVTLSASGGSSSGASGGADAQKAKLDKASHQFEAIFLRQMLSEARKTHFGNELFSGDAMDTFGSMEDSHFADIAADRDTLGIAKMLEKTLSHRLGLDAAGQGTGASATGTSSSGGAA